MTALFEGPTAKPGQVWSSKFQTGVYVTVRAVDGTRVQIAPAIVEFTGVVTLAPALGDPTWIAHGRLWRTHRLTRLVLTDPNERPTR